MSVFHQVKLEACAVDCGVDGKVVNPGDFAGEASCLCVVVTLLVEHGLVEVDYIAHGEG